MNNPAELIELMEDIGDEISVWNCSVDDVHIGILKFLSEFQDCRTSLQSRVRYLEEEVADHNEQASQLKSGRDMLAESIVKLATCVADSKRETEKLLRGVTDQLNHWVIEKLKAENWVERADFELTSANTQLILARNNLQQAETKLVSAREALRACKNSGRYDNHGNYYPPNCSNQSRDVGTCFSNVSGFQAEVNSCNVWFNRCVIEQKKANARLGVCVNNVEVASYGKAEAECADSIARNAVRCREKTDQSLHTVTDKLNEIKMNQKNQKQCLDAMQDAIDLCKERLNAAEDVSHNIKSSVQGADDFSSHARHVLSGLGERLESFDVAGSI